MLLNRILFSLFLFFTISFLLMEPVLFCLRLTIPKLFSSSIHTINNIKEFTNSSPQTESIKEAPPEALVRRKILLKNMMRKNNLEGNGSFTLHSYKL